MLRSEEIPRQLTWAQATVDTPAEGATRDLSAASSVLVLRWSGASPYAPALYLAVGSEPAHEGKFQDRRGNWFEIQTDDEGYLAAAQLGDGIDGLTRALAISRFVRGTPDGTYTISTTLEIEAGSPGHLDLRNCTIVKNTNNEAILVRGEWINELPIASLSINAELHSVLNFASAAPYEQSALLKVISDDSGSDATAAGAIIAPYAIGAKAGEFATVMRDPETTAVSLGHKLLFHDAYVTNPRVAQMVTTGRTRIDIGTVTLGSGVTGDVFVLDSAFGVDLDVFSTPYGAQVLVRPQGCHSCFIRVRHHKGGPESGGYGIVFTCSENCWGQVDYCGPVRHVGDGGGNPSGSYSDFGMRGLAQNCGLINSYTEGALQTPYATHHGTRNFGYINCRSRGSAASAIAFRGTDNYAINCESREDISGFGQFNQSGALGQTKNSRFINCRVIDPKNKFLAVSAGKMVVQDCTFERTRTDAPDTLFELGTVGEELKMVGGSVVVSGCNLGDVFTSTSGTVAAPATRSFVVENVQIDARGLDAATNLPVVFNAGVTDVASLEYRVRGLTVLGEENFRLFGGMTDTSLFTAATSLDGIQLPPSARLHNTIPDSAFAGLIKDPVWLGATPISLNAGLRLAMADDTAQSIPIDGAAILELTALAYTGVPKIIGGVYVRTSTSATPVCVALGSWLDATNISFLAGTVLTGTTGIDGDFSISAVAADNLIYFENRTGAAIDILVKAGAYYRA